MKLFLVTILAVAAFSVMTGASSKVYGRNEEIPNEVLERATDWFMDESLEGINKKIELLGNYLSDERARLKGYKIAHQLQKSTGESTPDADKWTRAAQVWYHAVLKPAQRILTEISDSLQAAGHAKNIEDYREIIRTSLDGVVLAALEHYKSTQVEL